MDSLIPAELIEAYEATHFRVLDRTPFTLLIDQYCPELSVVYEREAVRSAAFLTAFNPLSVPQADEVNEERQDKLETEIRSLGFPMIPGFGVDPSGKWKGERSCLALGMMIEMASDLGMQFGQNAIVFADGGAVPRLVLLR